MSRPSQTESGTLILASASPTRCLVLKDAGVTFQVVPALVRENEIKHAMMAEGAVAADIAATLAEIKACQISNQHPYDLVIGTDQVLNFDGGMMDKPRDRTEARDQLVTLRGRWHELVSAVCVVQDGVRQWHHVGRARLLMRGFSDGFLDAYLEIIGERALAGPGAYQIEGSGAQLFERMEGDYFTILGLPLLPLLDYLRSRQVLTS